MLNEGRECIYTVFGLKPRGQKLTFVFDCFLPLPYLNSLDDVILEYDKYFLNNRKRSILMKLVNPGNSFLTDFGLNMELNKSLIKSLQMNLGFGQNLYPTSYTQMNSNQSFGNRISIKNMIFFR